MRLIVPFPPGGGTDIVGRLLAQKLGEGMAHNLVVDKWAKVIEASGERLK